MRIGITVFAAIAMSACSTARTDPVPEPQPPATPVIPAPAPTPAQPAGNWTDRPLSSGDWVYRKDNRGSLALFGPPSANALFMIRCDAQRKQLFLSRVGNIANIGAVMTLRAGSGLKSYPARSNGGQVPYAAIAVNPNDFMMDRIASSRGRFAVEATGLASLAIPNWPEFIRVVEDCRQ